MRIEWVVRVGWLLCINRCVDYCVDRFYTDSVGGYVDYCVDCCVNNKYTDSVGKEGKESTWHF